MDSLQILFMIENLVFWSLVIAIAWLGADAPVYIFTALFVFLIYWSLRIVLFMHGMNRAVGIYTINIIIIISLLFYFLKN
jgi:hypothetical protein